jgi:23S rRNA pseudouridine1911/1915/1917 synthase
MDSPSLDILYEDNHCIAVAKPSGIATTHFQGTEQTLDRMVKAYLKEKYKKPGNVFLGIVHRLDKPVSGVVLFARTSKAAARISEQFREGSVDKVYWAMVEGIVQSPAGTLEDWLLKNKTTARVEIVDKNVPRARQAILHYIKKAEYQGITWLELRPQTGRTHQLRVQLAHRGHPIYGDAKYGAVSTFYNAIGLHSHTMTFLHPILYEPVTLRADPPRIWLRRFAYLLRDKGK